MQATQNIDGATHQHITRGKPHKHIADLGGQHIQNTVEASEANHVQQTGFDTKVARQ